MRNASLGNSRLLIVALLFSPAVLWFSYLLVESSLYSGIHRHDGWTTVDLKRLGFFEFNPETDGIDRIPARFRALDGQRVVLEGFMYNGSQSGGSVRQFEFVYNRTICCFGGKPLVQERVFARCPAGKTVPLSDDLMVLTGVLHARIERECETGFVNAVYELDVEKIESK